MSETLVILCPGQGAQSVGMGRSWMEHSAAAGQVFGAADEILGDRLGAPLSELCFGGPAETLDRTDVAQPALFVVGVASYQALFGDVSPADLGAVAGLSLGEYTALHLAGAVSFADGLELVALRGRAMQDAAEEAESGMVALVGADEAQAREVCEEAAGGEVLVCANLNAPGQLVISGSSAACDRALDVAQGKGLRATRLSVAGAFHSPIMAPAAARLREALEKVTISTPSCPVLSNVTGVPHAADEAAGRPIEEAIRDRLVEQLTSPVRWSDGCRWLASHVEGSYHELAPGKVLSGLFRRIDRAVKVTNHDQAGE
jgi:[acyl-carrier-protein] S-malonyltransferase